MDITFDDGDSEKNIDPSLVRLLDLPIKDTVDENNIKIISSEIKLEKKPEILVKKLTTVINISSDFILFLKKLTTGFITT